MVTITVEDFGGVDKVREFYDRYNKAYLAELQDFRDGCGGWYTELSEYIIEAVANQEDNLLPPKIVEKLNQVEYEYGEDWELSEEIFTIAEASCDDFIYDEKSSDEEKACHEITEVLEKYNVSIYAGKLGGVWIGRYRVN